MKKIFNLMLALSIAVIMSGCGASGEIYEGDDNQHMPPNNNNYNDNIYSDTDDDFGYNDNNDYNDDSGTYQSIDIYDIDEGSYTITGYNNYGEDIELNFYSDGISYSYSRDSEYFNGTFKILYGEIQMSDNQGGSYVLVAENDELVVGNSYFCDALGRELTITSITGGSLY